MFHVLADQSFFNDHFEANNPYACYLLIDSYTSSNLDPLCMLYFEEHVYGIGHYQSIRSVNNENFTKI